MEIFIIILLILAGIVLFLIEVFLVPGISLAGIGAGICLVYANYHAFTSLSLTSGIITLTASAIGCIAVLAGFMRSKTLDRLSLKKNIDSNVSDPQANNIKAGDKGISTTRLALIGYAEINGHQVEVKSTDGFLDEKTPIEVKRIDNGVILVQKTITNQSIK